MEKEEKIKIEGGLRTDQSKIQEDEEGIMDTALEKLRGGEAFSAKRKERRQSNT